MKIKVIVTRIHYTGDHQKEVNEFLRSNIEVIEIKNEVHSGNAFSKYTGAELVTFITYKELNQ